VSRPPSPLAAVGAAGPPRAGVLLGRAVAPLDRLFDRIYGSRWNPLYQSGNLAVLCFLVTLVTGIYLFLFYRIADPHASVAAIESEVFLGRWARSLHRYSADLAVVAVALHLLRKLIQGQTWGPRALAWTSGVLLLGVVLLCGWSGLVLVWDVQGQEIALQGARLLDLLPVFSEPISRMFSGVEPVPSSFFFMNLFLHVALPLGIAALLGVHVARVARPALLPPRPVLWGVLATLALVALLWPVGLPPAAQLAALPGEIPTDLLFAFWLPLAQRVPPIVHLALWMLTFATLFALVRLWRPGHAIRASRVDEERCTGCTHCYQDCPYEAIAMVRRERPARQTSELVARVDPALCVGCGICAAACAPMGIGPGRRTGRDQLAEARDFADAVVPTGREVALLACRNGFDEAEALLAGPGRALLATGCAGSVHMAAVELLLRRGFAGVFLLTCPPRNCHFREGPKWLAARLHDGREAELPERVDRRRIAFASLSLAELGTARRALAAFEAQLAGLEIHPEEHPVIPAECDTADAERLLAEMARG
jgi:ferredoxin